MQPETKKQTEVKLVEKVSQASASKKEDYSDMMKEENRIDNQMRFDEISMENKMKLHQLQGELRTVN